MHKRGRSVMSNAQTERSVHLVASNNQNTLKNSKYLQLALLDNILNECIQAKDDNKEMKEFD